jgi:2-polyprenyl-3-methyl-5-hydroxy-6-metoxy-1,4-benzoquinol methylase
MIKLENYTDELVEKNGIYFAKQTSNISYPESGNQDCYQLEEDSFWFKHRNDCIIEAIKKHCPENVFFDIGGGNGFVSKALQDSGIASVLVEPGIQGCLNAQKRNLKTIICSTLENASFKKDTIGAVGLFDVVEHIEDDVAFLKSIHYYLDTKGYVFISVPAFQALWSNEDVDAGHYRRYTTKQMEEKLKSVGFEIVQSTYIFSILPVAVYLFRTLPSKMGLNKKSNEISKHKQEHKPKTGVLNSLMNKIWSFELDRIGKGKRIPVGGSCFVVAVKK